MKLLFISLFLPQEKAYHAGGRYVFEVLRQLSERHEIHLVTRLGEDELPLLESLIPFCKTIHPYTYSTKEKRGPIGLFALGLNYLGFSCFADRIASKAHFDIIHVEWVEAAAMIKRRTTPMLLTAQDVITKPAERRMRAGRGLRRLLDRLVFMVVRTLELRTMRRFDTIFTLSEYDKKYLLALGPGLNVRTNPFPAGLDITGQVYERTKNTILFLASYKYRKVNVDAALYFYKEVLPLIRKSVPEAKFIIAGYGPPEQLRSLPLKDPGVLVPGFVENTDEIYKLATVFVAPILVGGGIIVKILDAMAAGTPVVTTTYGNEGIGALSGTDLLVADNPEGLAEATVRVLSDRELADGLSRNGQEFVRKHYTLEAAMSQIEAAYRELVK